MWVYGICSYLGNIITVAHNPANVTDFSDATSLHEFGHHWLHGSGHYVNHDPVYDSVFSGWATSRGVAGKDADGSPVQHEHMIFTDENGKKWIASVVPADVLKKLDLVPVEQDQE